MATLKFFANHEPALGRQEIATFIHQMRLSTASFSRDEKCFCSYGLCLKQFQFANCLEASRDLQQLNYFVSSPILLAAKNRRTTYCTAWVNWIIV
mmetsp:Transcript_10230/g.21368  ORF Transcript_10230/g.21368 Transcript_10230/m.21368 type:complete len:95 (+) Transcript_10230:338-622(+)